MFFYYVGLDRYNSDSVMLSHDEHYDGGEFAALCRAALSRAYDANYEYEINERDLETADELATELAEQAPEQSFGQWRSYCLEQAKKSGYGRYLGTCLEAAVDTLVRENGFRRVVADAWINLDEELEEISGKSI
jgi:hypothetical protein